jgi:UDP-3-O-[3-hydroxymyristoyl] glucosamine N-acyltransferase
MRLTLGEIAAIAGGELDGDPRKEIEAVAVFESAGGADLTYVDNARFLKEIAHTRAGAVLVPEDFEGAAPCAVIRTASPRLGFARVLARFHPDETPPPGISSRAQIGADTRVGEDVFVGAGVAVGDRVRLGDRVCLYPGVFIGDDAVIGDDSTIFPNVTIMARTRIGQRVRIQAGSVIGSDGFGFVPDGRAYFKIRHIGIVQIDDDVEIGANNTIDRGSFGKTHICRGVKTDNLVHVAHNVTVGEDTLLVAQVGIAGSVTIGRHAILAGQAGTAQHLTIGDNAIVGPQAGLTKSIGPGEVVSGTYAMPHRLWLRVQRILPRLPKLKKRIDQLEKRLRSLENNDRDAENN